jgi:hypothetical protein
MIWRATLDDLEGHAPSWPSVCPSANGRDRSASLHNTICLRPKAASGHVQQAAEHKLSHTRSVLAAATRR